MKNRNFVFFVSFLICFVFVFYSILRSNNSYANPLFIGARNLVPKLFVKNKVDPSKFDVIAAKQSIGLHSTLIGSLLTGIGFTVFNQNEPEVQTYSGEIVGDVALEIWNPLDEGASAAGAGTEGYSSSEKMTADPKQPKPLTRPLPTGATNPGNYKVIASGAIGMSPIYEDTNATLVQYQVWSVQSCSPSQGWNWCGNIASETADEPNYRAVFKHSIPKTCPSGFYNTGTECKVINEKDVLKPIKKFACDVLNTDDNKLYLDKNNPECNDLVEEQKLKVFEKKAVIDSEEVETTIEKKADGGNKITLKDKKTNLETVIETGKYDKSKGGATITSVGQKTSDTGTGGTGSGSGDTGSGSGDTGNGGTGSGSGDTGTGGGSSSGDGTGGGAGGECGIEGKPDCKVDVDDSAFDESWNPEVEKQTVLDEEKAGFESFVNAFSFENNFGVDLSKYFDQIDILPERNCSPLVLSFLGKELRIELCQKLEPIRIILGYLIWVVLVIGLFHLFIRTTADNRTQ